MKAMRKLLIIGIVLCYISAAASGIIALSNNKFPIDGIIIGVLGVLIHIRKSFIASLLLLAYSIINFVFILITMEQFGGWLIVVLAVCCVIATYRIDKVYKDYKARGITLPTQPAMFY
jgi:hypothetical protein